MEKQKVCKLTYQSIGSPKPKTFYIKPLKLFSYHDAIYLHAQKAKEPGEPYRAPKFDPLLAVHRMKSVEMTPIKFQPDKFDFEKAFNQQFGIIKEKVFNAEVAFTGGQPLTISERIWSPIRKLLTRGK
jgi:hypothetical protein